MAGSLGVRSWLHARDRLQFEILNRSYPLSERGISTRRAMWLKVLHNLTGQWGQFTDLAQLIHGNCLGLAFQSALSGSSRMY